MQKYAFAALMAVASAPVAAQSVGHASFYGNELAGRKTASGEKFNPGGLTAAHRSLPFGTRLKLTNVQNGRSVVVRVNDRGPFVRGRVLDVSKGAAVALGFVGQGTARLRIENHGGGTDRDLAAAKIPAPALDGATPDISPVGVANVGVVNHADRALQNK